MNNKLMNDDDNDNQNIDNVEKEKFCNNRVKLCSCVFLSAGFVIAFGMIDVYIAMKNDDNSYSII